MPLVTILASLALIAASGSIGLCAAYATKRWLPRASGIARATLMMAGVVASGALYSLRPVGPTLVRSPGTLRTAASAVALDAALLGTTATLCVVAASLPFRLSGSDASPILESGRLRRRVTTVWCVLLLYALSFEAVVREPPGVHPIWLVPATFVGFSVYSYRVTPEEPIGERARPSDEVRERIRTRCEELGLSFDRIGTFEAASDDRPLVRAFDRGSGPELLVAESLLAESSDEELATAIGQAEGLRRGRYQLVDKTWTALLLTAATAAVWTFLRPDRLVFGVALILGSFAGAGGAYFLHLRIRYAADDFVASRLGVRTVLDHYADSEHRLVHDPEELERRIERLEDVADSADAELDRTGPMGQRRRRLRIACGIASVTGAVALVLIGLTPDLFWIYVVLIATEGAYVYLANPIEVVPWDTARNPGTDERERIDAAVDAFDGTFADVVVFTRNVGIGEALVGSFNDAEVMVTSTRGGRRVWIEESLLADISEAEFAVALAQAAERSRRGHYRAALLQRTVMLLAYGIPLWTILTWQVDPVRALAPIALIGVAGLVVLPTAYVLRKRVYRADDAVVDRLGADAVVATYRRIGPQLESSHVNESDGRMLRAIKRFVTPEPDTRRRADRLAARTESESGSEPAIDGSLAE